MAGYTIGNMLPSEFPACLEICADTFCNHNVFVKHIGMTKEAWKLEVRHAMEHHLEDGMSVVARDATGIPVAFVFVRPFTMEPTPQELLDNPKVAAVCELLGSLYNGAALKPGGFGLGSLVWGRTAYVPMIGTDPSAHGKGLQKMLCQRAFEVLQQRGFNRIVVEAANPATSKIFEGGLGFRAVETVVPADFAASDGTKPWRDLDRRHTITLLEYTLKRSPLDGVIAWPWALLCLLWRSSGPAPPWAGRVSSWLAWGKHGAACRA